MMRRRLHTQLILTLTMLCLALLDSRAQAGPLNPLDFTSLGASPFGAVGTYTIDTDGPTLTGPGIVGSVNGVVFAPDNIAVFTFDSITIGAGININGIGTRPFALLSHDFVMMNGGI